jgi:hypothetical protein
VRWVELGPWLCVAGVGRGGRNLRPVQGLRSFSTLGIAEKGDLGVKRNAESRRAGRKTLRVVLERSSVGLFGFVGFRDFRGFLDEGVDRYGAKVAKGRKGRGRFGGKAKRGVAESGEEDAEGFFGRVFSWSFWFRGFSCLS